MALGVKACMVLFLPLMKNHLRLRLKLKLQKLYFGVPGQEGLHQMIIISSSPLTFPDSTLNGQKEYEGWQKSN